MIVDIFHYPLLLTLSLLEFEQFPFFFLVNLFILEILCLIFFLLSVVDSLGLLCISLCVKFVGVHRFLLKCRQLIFRFELRLDQCYSMLIFGTQLH